VTAGCNLTGPSDDLTGTWVSNSGDHFTFATLTLRQEGDTITGTACESSAGMLYFRGVPVVGDYPSLTFTVAAQYTEPCCASVTGSTFIGRRDSSGDIVGTYRGRDIRFQRRDPSC
jgi:hypothetical protein